MPGHWELIVLGVVLLLLFGSKQVPQLARQLGRSVREVKDTMSDIDPREEIRRTLDAPAERVRPPEAPEDEARAGETADPRDRF